MFENIFWGITGLVCGVFITWVIMRDNNPISLFVYEGGGNGPVVPRSGWTRLGRAVIKGFAIKIKLYDGTLYGLLSSAPDDSVKGQVYAVQRRELPECDDFAGHLYRRVTVLLTDGTAAETYVWTPDPPPPDPGQEVKHV